MADENKKIRKEAIKLAEKEAKKNRKKAKKNYKRELKKEKREIKKFIEQQKIEERSEKKHKSKKKYHLKKRFIVFIIIILAALAVGGFFAVKYLLPLTGINLGHSEIHDPNAVNTVINENEVFDSADPANIITPLSDVIKNLEESEEPVSILQNNSLGPEYKICASVLSDWHISPLGQDRRVIEQTFGELYRYEDWNEGVYYHRGFPETMYITYNGDVKGSQPAADAICDSVSICLKYIIEFDEFTPDTSLWGKVNKTASDEGWTNYFYSVMIKEGINLIVYCDKDGNINKETHIIVRKV